MPDIVNKIQTLSPEEFWQLVQKVFDIPDNTMRDLQEMIRRDNKTDAKPITGDWQKEEIYFLSFFDKFPGIQQTAQELYRNQSQSLREILTLALQEGISEIMQEREAKQLKEGRIQGHLNAISRIREGAGHKRKGGPGLGLG